LAITNKCYSLKVTSQCLLAGFKQMTQRLNAILSSLLLQIIVFLHRFQELYSLAVEQMLVYYHSLSNCFLMSSSCGVYLQSKYPQLL